MKQGWLQTLGGLAILTFVPVLTILCLSPDVHEWVRNSLADHSREQNSSSQREGTNPSERIKHYRLPDAISKIAVVSEEEPDLPPSAAPSDSSSFSRAVFRLQRALQANPDWDTKEIFHAANKEAPEKIPPCPFERIDGEQSVFIRAGKHSATVTETLNRCAAAVEQITGQEHQN